MRARVVVSLFVFAVLGASRLKAEAPLTECQSLIANAVQTYQAQPTDRKDSSTIDSKLSITGGGAKCMVALILSKQTQATKFELGLPQRVAAFQQNGANAGSGGSTALVSKGATAKVLSAAAEYGGLTESTSNQVVTFSGTLGGIPTMLGQKGLIQTCPNFSGVGCVGISTINALNRLSYSVAFNTTQNTPSVTGVAGATATLPSTFTASNHSLNEVTGKAILINGQATSKDTLVAKLDKAAVADLLPSQAIALEKAYQKFAKDCPEMAPANPTAANPSTPLGKWAEKTSNSLRQPGADATKAWDDSAKDLIDALEKECKSSYLNDALAYASAFSSYQFAENTFYESLRAAPMLSLEYDYNTPANQPTNSTVKLIGQMNKNGWTGSLNAAGSFYNSTPSATISSAGKVRDFQIAGEGAYNFNQLHSSALLGDSTFSLAYYYQDQTSPAILNGLPSIISGLPSSSAPVFAKRGVINIAQAKFAFIPRNANINLPISVTWSNRTELVTKPVWRGQVGISYNFDSLFSVPSK